jgi:hypothetical protein
MDISGQTIMGFTSWMTQNHLCVSIPGIIIGLSGIYYGWRTRTNSMLLVGVSIVVSQVLFIITVLSLK